MSAQNSYFSEKESTFCLLESDLLISLMLFLSACVLFISCLRVYSFDFEGFDVVIGNPHLRDWRNLAHLFSPHYFATFAEGGYRPMASLVYFMILWISGPRLWVFQLVKVLLLCGAGMLVTSIGRRLFRDPWLAGAAGLIFLTFPPHIVSLTPMTMMPDFLSLLFCLLAFWSYVTGRAAALVGLCYALALLSKEPSVALLGILPAYDFIIGGAAADKEAAAKRRLHVYVILALLTAAFAGLVFLRIAGEKESFYGSLLFVRPQPLWRPITRVLELSALFLHPFAGKFTAAAPASAGAILFAFLFCAGFAAKSFRQPVFCLLWIILCLSPLAGILPMPKIEAYLGAQVAPFRYLCLAAAGFSWGACSWLRPLRTKFSVMAALLLMGLAGAGLRRSYAMADRYQSISLAEAENGAYFSKEYEFKDSRFWGSMVSLSSIARRNPQSYAKIEARMRAGAPGYSGQSLVDIFKSDAIFDDPERVFCVLKPVAQSGVAHFHARLRRSGGSVDALIARLRAATAANDEGVARFLKGDVAGALRSFKNSVASDPENVESRINLGVAFAIEGNAKRALEEYTEAIRLGPRDPVMLADALSSRATTHLKMGHAAEALSDMKEALRVAPPSWRYEQGAVHAAK